MTIGDGLEDANGLRHVDSSGNDLHLRVEPEGWADNKEDDAQGMRITFRNVNYVVNNSHKGGQKKVSLLKGLSGFFIPGQMAALMGPSGSGKTTLLDVLAGRKTAGKIEGEILFSGLPPSTMFLRRYTGYVEQFDTLLDILTVEEMLLYTAELKRAQKERLHRKREAVNVLLGDLGLEACRHTRIGNAMNRGISGGQAKRTNIAIALITNPRVLFLDEPTSGLDSYTANEVMSVVKRLTRLGITICATIHSPTPYAFRLFDRLMLLLRGRMVYFGERSPQTLEYFKGLPAARRMAASMDMANEAEWIVDLTTQADRQNRSGEFGDLYDASALREANELQLAQLCRQGSGIDAGALRELSVQRATVTSFWWGLRTLVKYRTSRNYRNMGFLGPRIGDKLVFSLLIFTLYFAKGADLSAGNIINIAAILFMWSTLPAFGAASYVPSIVLERPLFARERNDGLYRVVTYLCAKMVDELLLAALAAVVFSCVVFFPIKLKGAYLVFFLVYLTTLSCGIVLAYTVAALSPNMDVANAALPAYVVTLLFFAGFLIRYPDIPIYWKWYSKLDFLHFAWSAQMLNQFEGPNNVDYQGATVVEFFDLQGSKWSNLGWEAIFFLAFFFLAWLALTMCKHSKR